MIARPAAASGHLHSLSRSKTSARITALPLVPSLGRRKQRARNGHCDASLTSPGDSQSLRNRKHENQTHSFATPLRPGIQVIMEPKSERQQTSQARAKSNYRSAMRHDLSRLPDDNSKCIPHMLSLVRVALREIAAEFVPQRGFRGQKLRKTESSADFLHRLGRGAVLLLKRAQAKSKPFN